MQGSTVGVIVAISDQSKLADVTKDLSSYVCIEVEDDSPSPKASARKFGDRICGLNSLAWELGFVLGYVLAVIVSICFYIKTGFSVIERSVSHVVENLHLSLREIRRAFIACTRTLDPKERNDPTLKELNWTLLRGHLIKLPVKKTDNLKMRRWFKCPTHSRSIRCKLLGRSSNCSTAFPKWRLAHAFV